MFNRIIRAANGFLCHCNNILGVGECGPLGQCYWRADRCDGVQLPLYVPQGLSCHHITHSGFKYTVIKDCNYCPCPKTPLQEDDQCLPSGAVIILNPVCVDSCDEIPPCNLTTCSIYDVNADHTILTTICGVLTGNCCKGDAYEFRQRQIIRSKDGDGINFSYSSYETNIHARICGNDPPVVIQHKVRVQYTDFSTDFDVTETIPAGGASPYQSFFNCAPAAQAFVNGTPPIVPFLVLPFTPGLSQRCNEGGIYYDSQGNYTIVSDQIQDINCDVKTVSQKYKTFTPQGVLVKETSFSLVWECSNINPCVPPCPSPPNFPPLCPDVVGVCCDPENNCLELTEAECSGINGVWLGCCVECTGNCENYIGGCCLPGGNCVPATRSGCLAQNGQWSIYNCNQINCSLPIPKGACCLPDGRCEFITESECNQQNGLYQGNLVQCQGPTCSGACCEFSSASGLICTITLPQDCNGQFLLGGTCSGPAAACVTINEQDETDSFGFMGML